MATIQGNPDIANHPEVAAAATTVLTQAQLVGKDVSDLGTARATAKTLETKRGHDALMLRLLHANLEALLNIASAGNKQAAVAWGGKIVSRTVQIATTDPPIDPTATSTVTGVVTAKCQTEKGVICYLFQMGSDPSTVQTWPAPMISGGSKHLVTGLPSAQKAYIRIAVVRRGTGQGTWSDVLTVTVK